MSITITGTTTACDTSGHPGVSQDFICRPTSDGKVEAHRVREGVQEHAIADSRDEALAWVNDD